VNQSRILEDHLPGKPGPDFAVGILKERFHFEQTAGWIHHRGEVNDLGGQGHRRSAGFDLQLDRLLQLQPDRRTRFDVLTKKPRRVSTR